MKRSTALLLALAALLAHALTLGEDARGEMGPPDDRAWVAFRMGRHAVQGLGPVWNPGEALADVYPSWAWVVVAWACELLKFSPQLVTLGLGLAFAALSVVLVSRFSPDRLAGVIAPLLLVLSGTLATAAISGTELCAFAAVLTAALLALETGYTRVFVLCLYLLPLVRAEGILCAGALLLLAIASRLKPRKQDENLPPQARVPLAVFLVPLAVWGVMALVRHATTGVWLSPTLAAMGDVSGARLEDGWVYLRAYFLRSGAPLLIVIPIAMALVRRSSPRGRRALALGLFWCAVVAWQGGDTLPFHAALAPAVPLLYVAVQEALVEGVDSRSVGWRRVAWGLFLVGLATSALASKLPADLGPLPLRGVSETWFGTHGSELEERFGFQPARLGVAASIERISRLRSIGLFARDSLPPGTQVATPWPGAIGYLSQQPVVDWFGRTSPLVSRATPASWAGSPRADLVQLFTSRPDYVVTTVLRSRRPPIGSQLVAEWIEELDTGPEHPDRMAHIAQGVRAYELISVPVPASGRTSQKTSPDPLYVLRLRQGGFAPELEIASFQGRYYVLARHTSHAQIVDLEVTGTNGDGVEWTLTPTGRFVRDPGIHARANILLEPMGERTVRLMEGELPEHVELVELTAVLRNPGSQDEEAFSAASRKATVRIR